MPEGIEVIRKGHARLVGRALGLRPEQPNVTVGQQRVTGGGRQTDVFAMPHNGGSWQALQVTDPLSANFGLFYFLPDYDIPGDPTKIVR